MRGGESDEEIVSTTMSELSAILVLVFFMCVALVVVAGREPADPRSDFPSEALQAKLVQSGCSFSAGEGGPALDVLTLNDMSEGPAGLPGQRNVIFEVAQSEPTPFGYGCLIPVCDELVNILGTNISQGELIFINGHTSSEWGDPLQAGAAELMFCPRESRESCEPCRNAFDCNLLLSTRRAISIFRLCYGRLAPDGGNAGDLASANFYDHFRVGGISSAESLIVNGVEDAAGSRRVDFVIQQR